MIHPGTSFSCNDRNKRFTIKKRDWQNVCKDLFLPRMGKTFSLYLNALFFFLSSFYLIFPVLLAKRCKRKNGGGKIKEKGKAHVHHNFWRHKYCLQTARQNILGRGAPAQKSRTDTQLECSNTQDGGAQRDVTQQTQALLTVTLRQYEGQHDPGIQGESGAPRGLHSSGFA